MSDVPAVLRYSKRARRLTVRVHVNGRVEIVAPLRTADRRIRAFLDRHGDWITRQRERVRLNAAPDAPFPPAQLSLAATGEVLNVAQLVSHQDVAVIRRHLRATVIERARTHLVRAVTQQAEQLSLRPARISVRRQRTRWGSCSRLGTISLNACLMFQRPQVVEYLLVHELMHLTHMNHSAQFWFAVAQRCPDWRALDRELVDGWRNVPRWMFD
jgi:predicted metal-dependent hydrolase